MTRPFALVGGRTRASVPLSLETLVTTAGEVPARAGTSPETLALLRLCSAPRSVAEVSALLHLPLAVARVLVSDAVHAGLVRTTDADVDPDLFLEEVLDAFRNF
ncbi:DUF742 domain-containing protein [Kineococcus terrestris]|uniref:DUF742 domain-containing protein n=1 Tax=Kineococcus terrestris TaxID=2044856 RepID=UPI0034DAD325